jgi:hypothetical protein
VRLTFIGRAIDAFLRWLDRQLYPPIDLGPASLPRTAVVIRPAKVHGMDPECWTAYIDSPEFAGVALGNYATLEEAKEKHPGARVDLGGAGAYRWSWEQGEEKTR